MHKHRSFFLVLLFSLSACASITQTKAPSRPITGDWRFDQVNWTTGEYPMWILFDVFDREGKTELCAAYAFEKDTRFGTQSFNDRAIANSRINLGGDVLSNSLEFMRRAPVPEEGNILGEAQCVITETPWKDGYGDTIEPTYELTKSGNFTIYD